jgi:U3 small nucleolar RNA-associated protein 25
MRAYTKVARRYPQSETASEDESDIDDVIDDEDDGADAQPANSVYQTLLRSYQANNTGKSEPPRKRQKMAHVTATPVDDEDEVYEDAQESEDDAEQGRPVQGPLEEESDEEEEPHTDPFVHHFADPDDNELARRLKAISENHWTTQRLNVAEGGKCLLQIPGTDQKAPRTKLAGVQDITLKPRLVEKAKTVVGEFSELEQAIAPSLFNYHDVLYGGRTPDNAGRLRHLTCLHALNHIFKTRDRVIKNNAKLAHQTEDDDAEYRDQGFTRPKVLFLLETKQACVRTVQAITELCEFEQQENKKRFLDSFSAPEDKFSEDRPDDFRELFEGNDENEFRVGLKFTRKTLKLYSKFYNSDIIFASALGLRRAIESGDPKKKDYDFLSSIEIVIMEQADATLMQNWEHAEYVFSHLNLQPKDAHGCDFSRVRSWYLDGHSANIRQTIVLSAYLAPQINALYNKHMRNVAGRLKYTPDYTNGVIETLTHNNIKQTFTRFESPTPPSDPDARFKFFHSAILPQITRLASTPFDGTGGAGILVFIPSYLDFVRVRNSLVEADFSYASISEYTDATDVRKARSHFMSGRHAVLLYTGRAHHFHRYNIRGVKRVVFYGIPENPRFYEEVVGFVGKTLERAEAERRSVWVRCAFSKWEVQALERVVGSKRVAKMVGDKGDTFDFV